MNPLSGPSLAGSQHRGAGRSSSAGAPRGGLGLASCHLLGLVLPRRAHFRPRPSLCLGYVYVPCLDGLCPDLAETPVSCGPFSWQEQHASTPILEPSPVWLLRGGAVGTRRFQSLDEARVLSLFSLLQLMIFNVGATLLYITAFITCSASVELTSLKGTRRYNQQAAASFFSCLVMIAYGVSAFFSFQAWRGVGSNAATSQMAGGYA
uniref:Plasmolipin n=1 Tax=Sus scrofa TaxID=9823 RepID=A0A8D1X2S3_PIG